MPERRSEARVSADHDLLVRIDEQVKNLHTTFKAHADKTESKIDDLARQKADKTEIQEIKHMLEEKLPKESFDSVLKPITDKQGDQEARIRQLERVAYRLGGVWILVQLSFNLWITFWK